MLLDELESDPRLSVAQLTRLHERHRAEARYPRDLAEAMVCGSPALARAGGWLLRRWLKSGASLPTEAAAVLFDGLCDVRSHIGRLLLYQLLSERPELADAAAAEVAAFLGGGLADPRATARAWSVSALWALAARHPEHRDKARAALRRAKRDPEPCVRARLRQMGVLPYPEKKKPAAKGGGRKRARREPV